jgi:hypothetical protein
MTKGEAIIYKTIKDNIEIMEKAGMLLIDYRKVENKQQFRNALRSLSENNFILYHTSFISAVIELTEKGAIRIKHDNGF